MDDEANSVPSETLIEYGYPAQPGEIVRVFNGHMTKVASRVGVSVANTSHAGSLLSMMRAVTKIKNGGPGHGSIYILHYQPTEEQFKEYKESVAGTSRRINPSKYDFLINEITSLKQQIKDLNQRLDEMDVSRGR
jgi:hypothetical protein